MITAGALRAYELLNKPEEELYAWYLKNQASPHILAKTERSKKYCFYMWLQDLKQNAHGVFEVAKFEEWMEAP